MPTNKVTCIGAAAADPREGVILQTKEACAVPEIRPVRSSDRVQWDALWAGYLRFYRQHVSIEVTDGTFARLVDERVQPHGLVAERDGSLVGFVHYVFHPTTWWLQA